MKERLTEEELQKRRSELITFCKYYRGEDVCPFEQGTNEYLFWRLERQFVNRESRYKDILDMYIEEVEKYRRNNPNKKNILTSDSIKMESKAIIIYINDMIDKWMPHDSGIILSY